MGNMCEQTPTITVEESIKDNSIKKMQKRENLKNPEVSIVLPKVNPQVKSILDLKKPLEAEFNKINYKCISKRLSSKDTYFGQVNAEGVPHGLGKIFKQNGDLVIGRFENGVANGQMYYISTNQVYYQGIAVNGLLNCERGIIESAKYKYQGGFKNNKFENKGIQITQNTKYEGLFIDGKKKKGKFTWIYDGQTYIYQGYFNQVQQFSDNGILIEPYGKYEGSFLNGQKHGYGVYTFNSQLRYEGQYRYGKKWGKGKIINIGNTLCYEGEFQNGLPNGMGKGFKDNKVIHEGMFVQGIINIAF